MTHDTDIRAAAPRDAEAIAGMLARLADETGDGDAFSSTPDIVRTYGFGPSAHFSCLIAEEGEAPRGIALYFRMFSTTLGRPGVYVQDLWVAPEVRGKKVGQALLEAVAARAKQEWQAGFLRLTAHHHNRGAIKFYTRQGFDPQALDVPMMLKGAGFATLAERGSVSA